MTAKRVRYPAGNKGTPVMKHSK